MNTKDELGAPADPQSAAESARLRHEHRLRLAESMQGVLEESIAAYEEAEEELLEIVEGRAGAAEQAAKEPIANPVGATTGTERKPVVLPFVQRPGGHRVAVANAGVENPDFAALATGSVSVDLILQQEDDASAQIFEGVVMEAEISPDSSHVIFKPLCRVRQAQLQLKDQILHETGPLEKGEPVAIPAQKIVDDTSVSRLEWCFTQDLKWTGTIAV